MPLIIDMSYCFEKLLSILWEALFTRS